MPPGQRASASCQSWLISGGLGALGMLSAEWLLSGARHVHLLGRSGRLPGTGQQSLGNLSLRVSGCISASRSVVCLLAYKLDKSEFIYVNSHADLLSVEK